MNITKEYAERRREEVRDQAAWFALGYAAGADTTLDYEAFSNAYADHYVNQLQDEKRPYLTLYSAMMAWREDGEL